MKFVTRAQWGARSPKYVNKGELNDESTAHWNGPTITIKGKTTWDHSYCAGLVRGIQNFHMDGNGWSDIAYNFIPCPHGYIFEGRGLNTINGANGTNTGNRTSHAIMCLAGEGNPFPDSEKLGFRECVSYVAQNTRAPDRCKGHRDHKSTACPGDARYSWVHGGMPINTVQKDTRFMFHVDTDYRAIVKDAYVKIVGREPESQQVLDVWAWTVGASQGAGYSGLIHALLYEQRLREENKLKSLAQQLSDNKSLITLDLTEEVEQKILARVYADLTEKLNT